MTDTIEQMPLERKCERCGKLFSPRVSWQRFCKTSCRVAAHYQKGRVIDIRPGELVTIRGKI